MVRTFARSPNAKVLMASMDPWNTIARLSRQQSQELQNRKLRHFVNRHLYPFSPYYRKLFDENRINPGQIRAAADLNRLPFTSKADFIDGENPSKFIDFVLQPNAEKIRQHWPVGKLLQLKALAVLHGNPFVEEFLGQEYRPAFITFTTGTTNTPISYLYTKYDINNLYVSGARMLRLFDIKSSEHIVSLFPFAPHLAFWQVVFGGLHAGALILSTGGGKGVGTEGNIAAILKMRPSVILGVPSYVYHVLREAQARGERMEFVKKVVLGAAAVTALFKMKLAELLTSMGARDVAVFGTYGFTEARCAWAECPTSNDTTSGYHLYPDKEIFEIIDPETGDVKKEGEDGELVYTSIDSRGSSVIRFRTGDFVKGGITWDPCPHCKRQVPRLSSHIMRISNLQGMQISKIKGSLVNFNNFAMTLSGLPEIEEWQIEIAKKDNDPFEVDELIVSVSPRGAVNEAELAATIKKKLLLATEVSPNEVRFIPLPEMIRRLELETSNKEKRIVDKRPT